MKRIVLLLVFIAVAGFPLCGGDMERKNSIGFQVSIPVTLLYAGEFDPGVYGLSVSAGWRRTLVQRRSYHVFMYTGIDASTAPVGSVVKIPFGFGIAVSLDPSGRLRYSALVYGAPGIALFRPAPLFHLEAGHLSTFSVVFPSGWLVEAGTGISWDINPVYSSTVAEYSRLSVPVVVGMGYAF